MSDNMMVFAVIFSFIAIAILIWVGRVIYVAFFRIKDEREKWIVTKSLAQSFVVLFVIYLIQVICKFADYEQWNLFFNNLKQSIYIDPVLICAIILGITMFINKKKFGDK